MHGQANIKCNSGDLSLERSDATVNGVQSKLVTISFIRSQINIYPPHVLCGVSLFIQFSLHYVYLTISVSAAQGLVREATSLFEAEVFSYAFG